MTSHFALSYSLRKLISGGETNEYQFVQISVTYGLVFPSYNGGGNKYVFSQEEDLTQSGVDPFGEVYSCPKGTKFNVLEGYCAPTFDKREEFLKNSIEIPPEEDFVLSDHRFQINGSYTPYDGAYLDKLIADGKIDIEDNNAVAAAMCQNTLDAGTRYKTGSLSAYSVGELQTYMIVHPNGVGSFTSGVLHSGCSSKTIFVTATNRTDKTLEILAHYSGNTTPYFRIWDWSCMPGYPCSTGTSPKYVYSQTLSSMSCYYTMGNDGGRHQHNLMHYANTSIKMDSGNPPLWRNEAWLWNYCTSSWN